MNGCKFLLPQATSKEKKHSYWTYTVRIINNNITWKSFRKKFIEFGGTGIFASWKLLYQEDVFKNGNWRKQCKTL